MNRANFGRSPCLVVVASMLIGFPLAACRESSAPAPLAVVVDVLDGDTITIDFGSDAIETVRLLGVDTPETVDPTRPVQCYGAEASAFVESLLPAGTRVSLERDVEARDHFGRLLAYVRRQEDGLFVNIELLRHGYADISMYEPNTAYADSFAHAATSARTQVRGLWDICGGADVALDPPTDLAS